MICSGVSRESPGQGQIVRRRKRRGETGKAQRGDLRIELLQQRQVARQQPGLHFGHHPPGELQAAGGIQRNCNDSPQNASKECRHPLHGVVAPEQNPVSGPQAALVEGVGATGAQFRQLRRKWRKNGGCRGG